MRHGLVGVSRTGQRLVAPARRNNQGHHDHPKVEAEDQASKKSQHPAPALFHAG